MKRLSYVIIFINRRNLEKCHKLLKKIRIVTKVSWKFVRIRLK
ncbi:MAG: DUF2129 domain-containing protein [Colwellia sp.]|nr:DUF2129 domain-containing protein [Colwellia sp.]